MAHLGNAPDAPKAMAQLLSRLHADVDQAQALASRLGSVVNRLMQQPPDDRKVTVAEPGGAAPTEPFVPATNTGLLMLEAELQRINSLVIHLERMV